MSSNLSLNISSKIQKIKCITIYSILSILIFNNSNASECNKFLYNASIEILKEFEIHSLTNCSVVALIKHKKGQSKIMISIAGSKLDLNNIIVSSSGKNITKWSSSNIQLLIYKLAERTAYISAY